MRRMNSTTASGMRKPKKPPSTGVRAVMLFILIILHPYAPKVLNNVGFAYLTVACIDTTALATHLPQFFITFIVGSILFNGVCVLLMKPAKALAVKSVQKENA